MNDGLRLRLGVLVLATLAAGGLAVAGWPGRLRAGAVQVDVDRAGLAWVGGRVLPFPALARHLHRAAEEALGREGFPRWRPVVIEAHPDARWGRVQWVRTLARNAGFRGILVGLCGKPEGEAIPADAELSWAERRETGRMVEELEHIRLRLLDSARGRASCTVNNQPVASGAMPLRAHLAALVSSGGRVPCCLDPSWGVRVAEVLEAWHAAQCAGLVDIEIPFYDLPRGMDWEGYGRWERETGRWIGCELRVLQGP